MKIGMNSEEIAQTNVTSLVPAEWMREMCWQLAKLREDMSKKPDDQPMPGNFGHPVTPKPIDPRRYPQRKT